MNQEEGKNTKAPSRRRRTKKWKNTTPREEQESKAVEKTVRDPTERKKKTSFEDILKENETFEKFYQGQAILPQHEWQYFMEALRRILPTAFRICGSKNYSCELRDIMKYEYVPSLIKIKKVDDQEYTEPPQPLSWYPDELAWQYQAPRYALKKRPEFAKFHEWLVSQSDVGYISRQEAVSMLPPILLDVKSHHWVLDMCAAPGSKTAQLIEAMHIDDNTQYKNIPSGLIIANDSDEKRAHMLVHQVKRLQSPCVIVTQHDAGQFPGIRFNEEIATKRGETLKFDRILADVPCSGDGTMRKNATIWPSWHTGNALGLHCTQLKILLRGAQLLKENGRIVYSTCSFNPIENEAVVAEALIRCRGNLRLVDASNQLPSLKRAPGLSTWQVMNKQGKWVDRWEDQENFSRKYVRSIWPPANVSELNLERCWRIYPHFQNYGGFFIAVFEKTGPIGEIGQIDDSLIIKDPIPALETKIGLDLLESVNLLQEEEALKEDKDEEKNDLRTEKDQIFDLNDSADELESFQDENMKNQYDTKTEIDELYWHEHNKVPKKADASLVPLKRPSISESPEFAKHKSQRPSINLEDEASNLITQESVSFSSKEDKKFEASDDFPSKIDERRDQSKVNITDGGKNQHQTKMDEIIDIKNDRLELEFSQDQNHKRVAKNKPVPRTEINEFHRERKLQGLEIDAENETSHSLVQQDQEFDSLSKEPSRAATKVKKKMSTHGISYEEPFIFLTKDDPVLSLISGFYGLIRDFPMEQFLVRSEKLDHNIIYFVNKSIKHLLEAKDSRRLRVVNTGIKAFTRAHTSYQIECSFRFHQEGVSIIYPYIGDNRIVYVGLQDLQTLLSGPNPLIKEFSEPIGNRLLQLVDGGALFHFDSSKETNSGIKYSITLPVWRAKTSVSLLYQKEAVKALKKKLEKCKVRSSES